MFVKARRTFELAKLHGIEIPNISSSMEKMSQEGKKKHQEILLNWMETAKAKVKNQNV
jgi:hypothetical protein